MARILALDQGTTSSRALVFDETGALLASSQRELEPIYPEPGQVEHDPLAIWETQRTTAVEALARAGLRASEVSGLGIANQRETTIVWERASGLPIANAIVWQDRRTADHCERLKAAGLEQLFLERTGLVIDPYFSGTKLRWILDRVPGARVRAARGELAAGTVDSWLIWQLTGGRLHVTDPGNASRTLLYDIHRGTWDDELLRILEVPRELLPEVCASSGLTGETEGAIFGSPVSIAGSSGDQQAALFGQACFEPGMVKNTYGTGCFMLMNTGERPVASTHRLLSSVAWQLGGRRDFALEGSVFSAGAAVQWLRDGLGLIRQSSDVEALAASVPDSGGVVLVPAFAGLGAPHWDPYARGTIMGLTRGTTAAHLARATLEAIAYQTADVLKAMEADSELAIRELRVDGGACRDDLLMQIQADVLGVPVVRPRISETTALGAAYLAGLALGVWPDLAALAGQWSEERRFEPGPDRSELAARHADWARAVERSLAWQPRR